MMGGHVDITVLAGALLILVAGALQGAFAVPMKYARRLAASDGHHHHRQQPGGAADR
jgi:hypothetical protein